MWEDVCLCYVSNIERVSLTVGDICIMYIRGSVSSSDLWWRRRMFHLIERRASSLTSNASQYWLSSSYLTTTAKCQIHILEHFILSTLCHMISDSPLLCQDQDHPCLSVTSYFWGVRGGQCQCRSHPGVTQETPVSCQTPGSEETWDMTQWGVTTSVTPVIQPVVK